MVQFTTHEPFPVIADHMLEMWLLEDDGAPSVGMAKPYVEIVLSLEGTHFWKASKTGPEFEYDTGWVTPVQDGPRYARAVGNRRLIGARLYPWAANAWFGLLDQGNGAPPPHLSKLLGDDAKTIRDWLCQAPDESVLFNRFGVWLASYLENHKPSERQPQDLSLELSDNVETLAKTLNMSGPTLRRSFATKNGMSPKRWLMLRRIDQILRDPRFSDPDKSLAGLAAEYGYADQAHLAREMMRFTGSSPSTVRQRSANYPPHMRNED